MDGYRTLLLFPPKSWGRAFRCMVSRGRGYLSNRNRLGVVLSVLDRSRFGRDNEPMTWRGNATPASGREPQRPLQCTSDANGTSVLGLCKATGLRGGHDGAYYMVIVFAVGGSLQ